MPWQQPRVIVPLETTVGQQDMLEEEAPTIYIRVWFFLKVTHEVGGGGDEDRHNHHSGS